MKHTVWVFVGTCLERLHDSQVIYLRVRRRNTQGRLEKRFCFPRLTDNSGVDLFFDASFSLRPRHALECFVAQLFKLADNICSCFMLTSQMYACEQLLLRLKLFSSTYQP